MNKRPTFHCDEDSKILVFCLVFAARKYGRMQQQQQTTNMDAIIKIEALLLESYCEANVYEEGGGAFRSNTCDGC